MPQAVDLKCVCVIAWLVQYLCHISFTDLSTFGGFIVLTSTSSGTYRVPYQGFKGNYQSLNPIAGISIGAPACTAHAHACAIRAVARQRQNLLSY